jgi:alkylation response protein AidB-like acyl-CoA dehydrogenase
MDAYIDSEIARLFRTRNFWMYSNKQEMTFHGSQASLWGKESNLRIADGIREVLGLESLLSFKDAKAPSSGELEAQQRESLAGAHPGGTIEVQRVIIARRIGVSRTKEKAAATPSTMQQKQSH